MRRLTEEEAEGLTMISQELLDQLRCPLDPSHTRLEVAGEALVCQRCRLKFGVKEDIPSMLVEEAELPEGCATLADLPCQRSAVPAPPG
jgi:uncharacterized protein YbaR (Trm112 family)